jgi:phage anti-repressor protein
MQKDNNVNGFPTIYSEGDFNNGEYMLATELYAFLGLHEAHYAKWFKKNITDNEFFESGIDYLIFTLEGEKGKRGRKSQNAKLTLDMTKRLGMKAGTEQGEKVRTYFLGMEKKALAPTAIKHIEAGEETAKFFNNLLEDVARYSPTARQTVGADIAKKIYGIDLPYTALPLADERYSCQQIADILNKELDLLKPLTENMVGRITTDLNLKRPPYAQGRLTTAKWGNQKEVTQYYYSPQALDKIREFLTNK